MGVLLVRLLIIVDDRYITYDLYRAKPIKRKERDLGWITGSLMKDRTKFYLAGDLEGCHKNMAAFSFIKEVDPATVCRFSGRYDSMKEPIFEHDIIEWIDRKGKSIASVVLYSSAANLFYLHNSKIALGELSCVVIGNEIDNPGLLMED